MEVNTELNNTVALERRMLSIKDLSDYLGVSPQTIYNRLSAGTFPIKTKRIGRRLKWDRRDGNWHISVERRWSVFTPVTPSLLSPDE
jgi:predicted DNA-binding transcriptional regulator AlpA